MTDPALTPDPAFTPEPRPPIDYSEPMLCDACDRILPNVFSVDGRTLLCPECHLKQAAFERAEAALDRAEALLVDEPLASYDAKLLELIGELVNVTASESHDMFTDEDRLRAAEAMNDYLNNPSPRLEFGD